jgi:hypothetical protein
MSAPCFNEDPLHRQTSSNPLHIGELSQQSKSSMTKEKAQALVHQIA